MTDNNQCIVSFKTRSHAESEAAITVSDYDQARDTNSGYDRAATHAKYIGARVRVSDYDKTRGNMSEYDRIVSARSHKKPSMLRSPNSRKDSPETPISCRSTTAIIKSVV